MSAITTFIASESGAVTVDWVVLTAAIATLGLAVVAVVVGGLETLSNEISTELAGIDAGVQFFGPNAPTTP
ncbi:MAG: hypothetical protein AAF914_00815 [Pseudomonadota bacterium]